VTNDVARPASEDLRPEGDAATLGKAVGTADEAAVDHVGAHAEAGDAK